MDDLDIVTIPNHYDYHGIQLNKSDYPPEHVDECRAMKLRPGDIITLTYPRTGETFFIDQS